MKIVRYIAAAATALMSLFDLPAAVSDSDAPTGFAIIASLLGLVGIATVVALLRNLDWAVPAMVAVGLGNLADGIVAVVEGWEGGSIGVAVSVIIVALAGGMLITQRQAVVVR